MYAPNSQLSEKGLPDLHDSLAVSREIAHGNASIIADIPEQDLVLRGFTGAIQPSHDEAIARPSDKLDVRDMNEAVVWPDTFTSTDHIIAPNQDTFKYEFDGGIRVHYDQDIMESHHGDFRELGDLISNRSRQIGRCFESYYKEPEILARQLNQLDGMSVKDVIKESFDVVSFDYEQAASNALQVSKAKAERLAIFGYEEVGADSNKANNIYVKYYDSDTKSRMDHVLDFHYPEDDSNESRLRRLIPHMATKWEIREHIKSNPDAVNPADINMDEIDGYLAGLEKYGEDLGSEPMKLLFWDSNLRGGGNTKTVLAAKAIILICAHAAMGVNAEKEMDRYNLIDAAQFYSDQAHVTRYLNKVMDEIAKLEARAK